jgi:hypothetical protein
VLGGIVLDLVVGGTGTVGVAGAEDELVRLGLLEELLDCFEALETWDLSACCSLSGNLGLGETETGGSKARWVYAYYAGRCARGNDGLRYGRHDNGNNLIWARGDR